MLIADPVLFAIIAFGIWTSIDDIKNGKISNFCIIIMLISGFLLNFFYNPVYLNYEFILNITISAIGGFILWWSRLWSAGDAKLFIGFEVIISARMQGQPGILPALILLRNSFIPVLAVLIVAVIIKTTKEQKKASLKKAADIKSISSFAIRFSSLFLLGILITKVLGLHADIFTWAIIIFIFLFVLDKFVRASNITFLAIAAIALSIMIFFGLFGLEDALNIAKYNVIFYVFLILFNEFGKYAFTREVSISKLKKGDVLAENIIIEDGKYKKSDINYISLVSSMFQKSKNVNIIDNYSGRLSSDNIEKINSLHKSGKLEFDNIKISNKMPFAPLIFMGCIITYFSYSGILLSFL